MNKKTKRVLKRRNELLPFMGDYVSLQQKWRPHVMYQEEPNFVSLTCNTDSNGYRLVNHNNHALDYDSFKNMQGGKGLICGGSTAFGVGASSDSTTITSRLNTRSNITWFGMAGRAHNSTQELIGYMLHLTPVDHIALFTGINNLTIHTSSYYFSPIYGSIFSQRLFDRLNHGDSTGVLISDLLTRIKRRIKRGFNPKAALVSTNEPLETLDSFESRYRNSISILRRDLEIWCALREKMGFQLNFFLQPISFWISRNFTKEELELFEIYEYCAPGWMGEWTTLQRHLTSYYDKYQADTSLLCQSLGIPWTDCNVSFPKHGWLFCDYAHLTDEGQDAAADIVFRSI